MRRTTSTRVHGSAVSLHIDVRTRLYLDAFRKLAAHGLVTTSALVAATGRLPSTVSSWLANAEYRGEVERVARGLYTMPGLTAPESTAGANIGGVRHADREAMRELDDPTHVEARPVRSAESVAVAGGTNA